jgi:hypothetical protein
MSIKIVANGKIEVNNVKPTLHFLQYIDSDARNSLSRTVPNMLESREAYPLKTSECEWSLVTMMRVS